MPQSKLPSSRAFIIVSGDKINDILINSDQSQIDWNRSVGASSQNCIKSTTDKVPYSLTKLSK